MEPESTEGEMRLQSLETSNNALTIQVAKLVDALKVVGELSVRQHEQAVAQAATDSRAAAAKTLSESKFRRVNTVQRLIGFLVVLAITVVPVTGSILLTNRVDHQFSRQQADLYSSCLLRNQSTVEVPRRQAEALAAAFRADNPAVAKIYQDTADTLGKVKNNCAIYVREK